MGPTLFLWLIDLVELYLVYSPPAHADGAVRRTDGDADAAEEHQRHARVAANHGWLPAYNLQAGWTGDRPDHVDELSRAARGVAHPLHLMT